MKLDEKTNRWMLEMNDVDRNPYRDSSEFERAIKRQSRSLYQWIYANINPANRDIVNEILIHDENYIEAIKEALIECYEADIETGFNDLKYQYGDNANYIPEEELIAKLIPPSAKAIMRSVYSSVNIFYAGFLERVRHEKRS